MTLYVRAGYTSQEVQGFSRLLERRISELTRQKTVLTYQPFLHAGAFERSVAHKMHLGNSAVIPSSEGPGLLARDGREKERGV